MLGLFCITCVCQKIITDMMSMLMTESIGLIKGICEWACWNMGDKVWQLIFSQLL